MSTSVRRHRLAAVVAGTAVVGATLFVSASPAEASFPSPTLHYCGSLLNPISDDGPVTDGIHHNLEPLIPALQPTVHAINCNVLAGLLRL